MNIFKKTVFDIIDSLCSNNYDGLCGSICLCVVALAVSFVVNLVTRQAFYDSLFWATFDSVAVITFVSSLVYVFTLIMNVLKQWRDNG